MNDLLGIVREEPGETWSTPDESLMCGQDAPLGSSKSYCCRHREAVLSYSAFVLASNLETLVLGLEKTKAQRPRPKPTSLPSKISYLAEKPPAFKVEVRRTIDDNLQ